MWFEGGGDDGVLSRRQLEPLTHLPQVDEGLTASHSRLLQQDIRAQTDISATFILTTEEEAGQTEAVETPNTSQLHEHSRSMGHLCQVFFNAYLEESKSGGELLSVNHITWDHKWLYCVLTLYSFVGRSKSKFESVFGRGLTSAGTWGKNTKRQVRTSRSVWSQTGWSHAWRVERRSHNQHVEVILDTGAMGHSMKTSTTFFPGQSQTLIQVPVVSWPFCASPRRWRIRWCWGPVRSVSPCERLSASGRPGRCSRPRRREARHPHPQGGWRTEGWSRTWLQRENRRCPTEKWLLKCYLFICYYVIFMFLSVSRSGGWTWHSKNVVPGEFLQPPAVEPTLHAPSNSA